MGMLDTLSHDEILSLLTPNRAISPDTIVGRVNLFQRPYTTNLFSIGVELVRESYRYNWNGGRDTTAEVVTGQERDRLSDAAWLDSQGCTYVDNGCWRYVVRVGEGLVVKAPFCDFAERQIVRELTTQFPWPTVDRTELILPSGTVAMLQEELIHCERYADDPGSQPVLGLPPIPEWVRDVNDQGQLGWSPTRKLWCAYDFN